jgi:hypothetical protein
VILPDGSELAAEMITGESKATELRHALAAINSSRKYIGICWDGTIRKRIQHYFSEAAIKEGERVQLVTKEELGTRPRV